MRNITITGVRGQAMVESLFAMLFCLTLFLIILQIGWIAGAQHMVHYAAYQAARVGIVTGGNVKEMRSAAELACAPLNRGGTIAIGNTTDISVLQVKWQEDLARGLTRVRIVHPTQAEFRDGKLHFDHFEEELKENKEATLTVIVTHYLKLDIPLINDIVKLFFPDQIAHELAMQDGVDTIRIPIQAKYTMRMQSDFLLKNVSDPPYFKVHDLPKDHEEMQKILK